MISMSFEALVGEIATRARAAADRLAELPTETKNAALRRAAAGLEEGRSEILAANLRDLEGGERAGLPAHVLDKTRLDDARFDTMIQGILDVVSLPDPAGEVTAMWRRPNGLQVGRMRIPLGVILVIYEARPNVTADIGALGVKSGNAVILRGGSEALESNRAIAGILRTAARQSGVPEDAIQLVPRNDYEIVDLLLARDREIDLVIPRGGEALIRKVQGLSRIPVIAHDRGVCHVYLDQHADPKMAREITINSKCQRVAVCNAAETLLVHTALADSVLPGLLAELSALGVEIRGCERTRTAFPDALPATEGDWHAEYLDKILSVRAVDSLDQAIEHIRTYGSNHTETIVTEDLRTAREFLRRVNSSTVLVNASTRFSDGFQLGLGAEVGISNTKIHWYGPMGLEGLTTQKFIAFGDGTVLE
jgi:glutamate-5-semialdehyde dehydrogenase